MQELNTHKTIHQGREVEITLKAEKLFNCGVQRACPQQALANSEHGSALQQPCLPSPIAMKSLFSLSYNIILADPLTAEFTNTEF